MAMHIFFLKYWETSETFIPEIDKVDLRKKKNLNSRTEKKVQ